MTILVGYAQGEGGTGGVQLGAMFAEAAGTDLEVATVVPKPWTTPSMAKVDAEFAAWTDQIVTAARNEVAEYMEIYPPDLRWTFTRLDHRTASAALIARAQESSADVLVISSTSEGQLGQIVIGSTGDALLHKSPVPVAIAPRGYRSPRDGQLTRITVAISGSGAEAQAVLTRAREAWESTRVPLRVVTFAVRGGAMYPPLVGLSTESAVLDVWKAQSERDHQTLIDEGAIPSGVECVVASGRGWRQAFDSIDWLDGEVLVVGSTREGVLAQVFIGSRSAKLIRHSSVPVVVLPR
ncbi:universal stress protein [Gordonia sp. NPDC003950]